jgi:Protein of unknown function (DUF3306)
MADDSFISRWSRRKAALREGRPLPPEPVADVPAPQAAPAASAAPVVPVGVAAEAVQAAPAEPPPLTLDDVAHLTRDSSYAAFVQPQVAPEVRNAALKKLFSDPHFNVMDGLDTYIDDYNTPDPLPAGMLRQMVQSQLLGLFDDDKPAPPPVAADAAPAAAAPDTPPPAPAAHAHEDAHLQLQPDDGAGRPGPEPGAGEDAGRPH